MLCKKKAKQSMLVDVRTTTILVTNKKKKIKSACRVSIIMAQTFKSLS